MKSRKIELNMSCGAQDGRSKGAEERQANYAERLAVVGRNSSRAGRAGPPLARVVAVVSSIATKAVVARVAIITIAVIFGNDV
jgi:hypothetical protein